MKETNTEVESANEGIPVRTYMYVYVKLSHHRLASVRIVYSPFTPPHSVYVIMLICSKQAYFLCRKLQVFRKYRMHCSNM